MKSYIVIGLGRFGSQAAKRLCELGCEVLAIDCNSDLVQPISGMVTQAVVADARDKEVLRALGAKKVAVMTPYGEEENLAEKKFLEDNGFEVLSVTGIGYNDAFLYSTADKRHLYRNARDIDLTGADAFYVSSMHFETLELVHVYEEDFHLPAVTSHQAALWAALRRAGINDKIPYLGKLFTL